MKECSEAGHAATAFAAGFAGLAEAKRPRALELRETAVDNQLHAGGVRGIIAG